MSDDFFAQLDADIERALKADKLKHDRNAAKKRLNTMTLSPAARARASEEYKALDALLKAQEWASVKTIALFTEQTCDGCGSVHRVFLQYMELQQMVKKPTTQQWVRVSKPDPEKILPRETLLQPMTTHICADCCEDHGFALLTASRLVPSKDALTPSPNYHQEDINAPTS